MKILAIEFSAPQRSVAVAESRPGFPDRIISEVLETGATAPQGLALIDSALREGRIERDQIDCVAVGLGPGSYTGIRGAIAVSQGWQLARSVKLLGLSSADCLAAQAAAQGLAGPVSIVIDAQRDEFYLASYELNAGMFRAIAPLQIVSREEIADRGRKGWVLAGPEAGPAFPGGITVIPRAAALGRLALGRRDFIAGEKLEPIYLRETKFVKAPPPRSL